MPCCLRKEVYNHVNPPPIVPPLGRFGRGDGRAELMKEIGAVAEAFR